MSASHAFPKSVRIRHKLDFRRTLEHGRKAVCAKIVIIGRERRADEPGQGLRLGLIVSRKVGEATVRTQVKRHLREGFRHMRADLTDGASGALPNLDLVVIARNAAAHVDGPTMQQALRDCYQRWQRMHAAGQLHR